MTLAICKILSTIQEPKNNPVKDKQPPVNNAAKDQKPLVNNNLLGGQGVSEPKSLPKGATKTIGIG